LLRGSLSITEWNAAIAGESDYSTALSDADAYGILGRERAYLASRWVAPVPGNPNCLGLKLYTNYDGRHHRFATTSVSATNNGSPNLVSSFAAMDAAGTTLTVMVLNKAPATTLLANKETVKAEHPERTSAFPLLWLRKIGRNLGSGS